MTPVQIRQSAREAYTEWLSAEPWDFFLTLTDPGLSHPEAMYKRTRFFLNQVNKSLYGNKWWNRTDGIEHVIGLERQTRGSVHSHTLFRLPDHNALDPAVFSMKQWQRFAQELGGYAWLEPPTDSEKTTDYVCKYVTKEGEIYISKGFNPHFPRHFSHTLSSQMVRITPVSSHEVLGSGSAHRLS